MHSVCMHQRAGDQLLDERLSQLVYLQAIRTATDTQVTKYRSHVGGTGRRAMHYLSSSIALPPAPMMMASHLRPESCTDETLTMDTRSLEPLNLR